MPLVPLEDRAFEEVGVDVGEEIGDPECEGFEGGKGEGFDVGGREGSKDRWMDECCCHQTRQWLWSGLCTDP